MTLQLQNLSEKKKALAECDTSRFISLGNSFKEFVSEIKIKRFRHIADLTLTFEHPVTIISGTNTIGKTSILLLLACSFERFLKIDSTSPSPDLREHSWKDVLQFTSHENVDNDYSYELKWRSVNQKRTGEAKRLSSSRSWSGLGKKSTDRSRINAKIRDREVRLIDLERILPGRSFSSALYRKANAASRVRLNKEVEKAFSYVFDIEQIELFEVGVHINKSCFLISRPEESYSSFNAASGEEAVIYLLKDIIESPKNSLILIDEIEAGFHPSVQRKLADIVQYISWRDKKQFVITTHSPTLISAFPSKSRRFIEKSFLGYRVIPDISHQAVRSKMDSVGDPLIKLYCEDDLASFLIKKILIDITRDYPHFHKLVNIIKSGPIDQVKNDYNRHKKNFSQFRNKIGYCAIFDGDYKEDPSYSKYFENSSENTLFIYPYDAPEKFLIRAYLMENDNQELRAALEHEDHHTLFNKMIGCGLATSELDAQSCCYSAFSNTPEYQKHKSDMSSFLISVVKKFSELQD
ncbi:MAG TPA: AAA family ATPase [Pseudobdellovibrionaceae bacterium]|jgi:predicted ATPase